MRSLKIAMRNGVCRVVEGTTEIRLADGDEIYMLLDHDRLSWGLQDTNVPNVTKTSTGDYK